MQRHFALGGSAVALVAPRGLFRPVDRPHFTGHTSSLTPGAGARGHVAGDVSDRRHYGGGCSLLPCASRPAERTQRSPLPRQRPQLT